MTAEQPTFSSRLEGLLRVMQLLVQLQQRRQEYSVLEARSGGLGGVLRKSTSVVFKDYDRIVTVVTCL